MASEDPRILDFEASALQRKLEDRTMRVVLTGQTVLADGMLIDEFEHQLKNWGSNDVDISMWLVIIMEELGEASKEVLRQSPNKVCYELTQVIACCIQAIRHLAETSLMSDTEKPDFERFLAMISAGYPNRSQNVAETSDANNPRH
jgi:hypothetical protein